MRGSDTPPTLYKPRRHPEMTHSTKQPHPQPGPSAEAMLRALFRLLVVIAIAAITTTALLITAALGTPRPVPSPTSTRTDHYPPPPVAVESERTTLPAFFQPSWTLAPAPPGPRLRPAPRRPDLTRSRTDQKPRNRAELARIHINPGRIPPHSTPPNRRPGRVIPARGNVIRAFLGETGCKGR